MTIIPSLKNPDWNSYEWNGMWMETVFDKSMGMWACWSWMKNWSGLEGFRVMIPIIEMKEGLEGSNSIPMRLSIGIRVEWLIRETFDLIIASLLNENENEMNTIQQYCVV